MRRIQGFMLAAIFWAGQGAVAKADSLTPTVAAHGMVVSAQYLASQIGADILRQGGNAIDAAVAIGYALAVVYPQAGNIGGGGFMTIRFADGRSTFLDFREKAPLAATETMYLDPQGNVDATLKFKGYLAVGVPGSVMGLDTALQRYGTLSREQVMAPAIKLAAQGFLLTPDDVASMDRGVRNLKDDAAASAIFLKNGTDEYQAGDRLIQADLAQSLGKIAKDGPDAFYKGPIADAIVAASERHHGILAKADFERYAVRELKPVECSYRGYKITSAPPPSSGGTTLCEMLNILEGYPLNAWGLHSAQSVHVIIEAMRHAYADRNNGLGDPDFIANPVERLTSKAYAVTVRTTILPHKAGNSAALASSIVPRERNETTHYSVIDAAGTAVAVTYTLNGWFGADVVADGTGIVLNDEMDDFTGKPGVPNSAGLVTGRNNAVAPGKTPLSSMTPTVLSKNGKTVLVIGSVGGPTIITAVLEAILELVDDRQSIGAVIAEPRFHHQWLPDTVFAEPDAIPDDTVQQLRRMGYRIEIHPKIGSGPMEAILFGGPSLVSRASDHAQRYFAVNDPRAAAGAAIGY